MITVMQGILNSTHDVFRIRMKDRQNKPRLFTVKQTMRKKGIRTTKKDITEMTSNALKRVFPSQDRGSAIRKQQMLEQFPEIHTHILNDLISRSSETVPTISFNRSRIAPTTATTR